MITTAATAGAVEATIVAAMIIAIATAVVRGIVTITVIEVEVAVWSEAGATIAENAGDDFSRYLFCASVDWLSLFLLLAKSGLPLRKILHMHLHIESPASILLLSIQVNNWANSGRRQIQTTTNT